MKKLIAKEYFFNKIESYIPKDGKIIYATFFGSSLFGTDDEKSDVDIKAIYIPNIYDIKNFGNTDTISFNTTPERSNTENDIDVELITIFKFFDMIKKGDANALDIVFSTFREETIIFNTSEFNIIKNNYKMLLSRNLDNFISFALEMALRKGLTGKRYNKIENFINLINDSNYTKKSRIKHMLENMDEKDKETYPIIERNGFNYIDISEKLFDINTRVAEVLGKLNRILIEFGARTENSSDGFDMKALSHSFRLCSELEELLYTDKITFPLKDKNIIYDIKKRKNNIDPTSVVADVQNKIDFLKYKINDFSYPEKISYYNINTLLVYIFATVSIR